MAMEYLYLQLPLLLLAIHIISQYFLHKLKNLPPCPFPSLPIIGHTYLLKKPYHRALSEISKKYGPLVFLRLGCRSVVLVSSPKLAEECFTKNDIVFADRPNILLSKHYGYNCRSLPWSSYGQHWRNLRRIATIELLSSHQIQMLSHFRADEILILIRKLFQETKRGTDKVVHVRSELFEFVFNVLTRMITGRRFVGKEAETFKEISSEFTRAGSKANVIDALPFLRWFREYRDTEKKMVRVQERRDRFMQDVMEHHRQRRAAEGGDFIFDKKGSMMDVLLDLQREDPEYYTDETIRSLLSVMFTAGSETSSMTLEWAFSLLLDNPNVLTKAQAQIDNLVGQERLINESDLAQLPYLHHIINETLRLQAPVPLLLPHQSSAECEVGGYNVPRGTILLVNAWNIHHSSDVWDDPEKFNPDRFQDFGNVKKECKLLPFGSGRRACPGENLAIRALALALGSLIQCFEWEKVSGIDMGETTGLVAAKVQPLAAKCNPRHFVGKLLS